MGGGTLPPPPKKKKKKKKIVCQYKNLGKNLGKTRGIFFFFCSSISFARITCRISCTPNPILQYRTNVGRGEKKKSARVPPAQQGFQRWRGFGQWIQDLGKRTPPPQKMNRSRTPMHSTFTNPGLWLTVIR